MSSHPPDPESAIDRIAPAQRPKGRRVVMYQSWRSLLFLHWEFPPEVIQPLLPKGLELDVFQGRAFVGLVPFTMRAVRPAGLPALAWLSNFHETNVRTYVHVEGRDPGVWFFSLEAANPLAVALARAWFSLPYYFAKMSLHEEPDADSLGGVVKYHSERRLAGASPSPATSSIAARVLPVPAAPVVVGTLDSFLIERYLLYTVRRGRLQRGQVHHSPYSVQAAELLACEESLLASAGISRPVETPIAHYCGGVDVEIFSIQPLLGSSRR